MSVSIPHSSLPRVLIVGGGFAGLQLVKSLRNAPVQIVMLDKHNYHTFQPLLYQVATGGLEPDSIATPFRMILEGQSNFIFRLAQVKSVDPAAKCVRTSIGNIDFDFLVLATGSRTNFFGNEALERTAMSLKSIPQALDLRSMLLQNFEKALLVSDVEERAALLNIVVVGGGPTGVEVSGALGELKRHVLPNDYPELDFRHMKVYLIEKSEHLLNGMSKKSSAKSRKYLEMLGVEVWTGVGVSTFDGHVVQLDNGKKLLSKALVWSAGVMGNCLMGLEPAVAKSNRLLVDNINQVSGFEKVFAIGDLALMKTDRHPNGHPMVAPVAVQQARKLGKNLTRIISGQKPIAFKYLNKGTMATIGRNRAVVEIPGYKTQGTIAWFVWMFVHIMSLVGFRNKLVVFVNWMWSYFSYDRGIRLIIRPYIKRRNSQK